MFDVKLLDIIQTICVGVFTVILIFYFYFIYNKFFVKEKFNEANFLKWISEKILSQNFKETGYLLIAIVFVYFFGIIAGDLTDRMTDSNNKCEKSYLLREVNYFSIIPTVGEIRLNSLIDKEGNLTTLGKSVLSTQSLVTEANKINKSHFFEDTINKRLMDIDIIKDNAKTLRLSNDTITKCNKDTITEFDKFIALMFYTSKNWCYSKEHEPLNELKSIQVRADLSRSIVLLTVLAIQILIIFYFIFIIINYNVFSRKRKMSIEFRNYFKSINYLTIKSLLLFITITFLCGECFEINLLSYNKRAFGYYVSNLASFENEKNTTKPSEFILNLDKDNCCTEKIKDSTEIKK